MLIRGEKDWLPRRGYLVNGILTLDDGSRVRQDAFPSAFRLIQAEPTEVLALVKAGYYPRVGPHDSARPEVWCRVCGHVWRLRRKPGKGHIRPKQCPRCGVRRWDGRPAVRGSRRNAENCAENQCTGS